MRYWIRIGERTLEVEVEGDTLRIDGEPVVAELVATGARGLYHLRLGDDAFTLVARREGDSGQWRIQIDGRWLEMEVVDERKRRLQRVSRASSGASERIVRAPMPGLVLQLHVSVGDTVEAGQPVAIVEAMKMENELRAPTAGKVTAVRVSPGDTVEKGAILVVLE